MTIQQTRRTGTAGSSRRPAAGDAAARRRSTAVLRDDEADGALGEVPGRVRAGIATWLRSPALDFYALLAIGGLLLGLGLVMVLSSSAVISIAKGDSAYSGLFRQGRFALIGLPLLVLAALVPPAFYKRMAWRLLILGFLLQLLVFVPGLGVDAYGNRNWIRFGSMQLQPSELLKLALAVWLGAIVAMKHRMLDRLFHLVVPIGPVVGLAIGLVVLGHDLGTALVMCMLVAGSLWVAGVPRRWFAAAAGLGLLGVLAMTITSPNRMARIGSWLGGSEQSAVSSDQSTHGLMALAEGGWWGRGLGESHQKWGLLPAADNDYIFAIIGEELGLLGTLSVLVLFGLLALVMFRMITRIDDLFVQVTVAGVSAWILGQAFTNMMVVTGLLPVLGVPLPFISAGGSALVTSMLALGMLLSFARHEPGAREAIGARIRRVRGSAAIVPASGATAGRTSRARTKAAARSTAGAEPKTKTKAKTRAASTPTTKGGPQPSTTAGPTARTRSGGRGPGLTSRATRTRRSPR